VLRRHGEAAGRRLLRVDRVSRSGITVMTMATSAWQPMPPPPPRKSNTLRTVLIVVGSILVLCCIGGVVGSIFLFKGVKATVGPVQDAADEFVTDLKKGDTTAAYALLRVHHAESPTLARAAGAGDECPAVSGFTPLPMW
jgi:hypothetical protein